MNKEKNHNGYHRWQRVVSLLSCVVMFVTTYALILPAITLAKPVDPVCGYEEHTHSGSCLEMQLTCELPESELPVHIHEEACYETRWEYTCDREETEGHTHSAACYELQETLCEIPENEGHTHDDSCYLEGELVCELLETEGHTHDASCTMQNVLVCELPEEETHFHGDACWTEVSTLICPLEEQPVEPHTHSEECYELTLTCEEPEHTHGDACRAKSVADAVKILAVNQLERSADAQEYRNWYHSLPGAKENMDDASFAFTAYVLRGLGAQEEVMLTSACDSWLETLFTQAPQLLRSTEEYTPVPGDLVFLFRNAATTYTVGIITDTDAGSMKVLTTARDEDVLTQRTFSYEDDSLVFYLPVPDDLKAEPVEEPAEEVLPEETPEELPEENPDAAVTQWGPEDFENGIGGYVYVEDITAAVPGVLEAGISLLSEPVVPTGVLIGGTSTNAVIDPTVYYRPADGSADWTEVTPGASIDANASFRIVVDYANLDVNAVKQNGYRVIYKIEDYLTNISASGKIDILGEKRGEITAEDGYVVLTFDSDWIDSMYSPTGTKKTLAGAFSYAGGLDLEQLENGNLSDLKLGDIDIQIPNVSDSRAQYAVVDLDKTASDLIHDEATDSYYLEYTVTVTAHEFGSPDVKLIDTLGGVATYVDKTAANPAGYIGVTGTEKTAAQIATVTETVTNGSSDSAPGLVYLTGQSAADMEDASMRGRHPEAADNGQNLAWYIGAMAPNEVRTLTYRVAVSRDYIGIPHANNDTITNTANLFSKNYPRGIENEVYVPTADADIEKTSSNVRRDGDWFYVDYEILVEADENNTYVMEDLKVYDHTNDGSAYREHVELLPETLKMYAADGTTEIPFSEYASYTKPNGDVVTRENPRFAASSGSPDDLRYDLFIGDLAPGESRIIRYTMRINEKESEPLANGNVDIYNVADLYSCEPRSNKLLDSDNTRDTVGSVTWSRKTGGEQIRDNLTIPITDPNHVYDVTSGSISQVTTGVPASYTIEASSFRYTVVINESGDWNVTSALMRDTLGTNDGKQLLKFDGYIELKVYEQVATGNNGSEANLQNVFQNQTPKATYWVKIKDLTSFNFHPSDLGLTDSDAYIMTYYAKFTDETGWGKANLSNTFGLSGTVGNGTLTFDNLNVYTSASKNVVETGVKDPEKEAWYYDPNPALDKQPFGDQYLGNGIFYWVVEMSGAKIGAGFQFQESCRIKDDNNWSGSNNSLPANILRAEGSHVGFYTAVIPDGETFWSLCPDKAALDQAIADGMFREVPNDYYTLRTSTDTGGTWAKDANGNPYHDLDIVFDRTYGMASGEKLYWIVCSEPTVRPAVNSSRTYWNKVNFRVNQTTSNWTYPAASQTLVDNSNGIKKTVDAVYIKNGGTVQNFETKATVNTGANGSQFRTSYYLGETESTVASTTLGDGTYISWLVSVNTQNLLDGKFVIVDELPAGVNLAYVRPISAGFSNWYSPGNFKLEQYAWNHTVINKNNGSINSYGNNEVSHIFGYPDTDGTIEAATGISGWESRFIQTRMTDFTASRDFAGMYYYVTNDNGVSKFAIDIDLVRGQKPITYQVVCKVDESARNPFEDSFYNNQAKLFTDAGVLVDNRGAEVMIGAQSANKAALISGLVGGNGNVDTTLFPYEIVVNGDAVDMVPDSSVITVPLVDRMSNNLKLSNDTLMIFKDKAYNTNAAGMPELVDGTYATDKNAKNIKYIWDNLIYYGGNYIYNANAALFPEPWYTTDQSKNGKAVGYIGTGTPIVVATIENSVDAEGNPVLHNGKPMRSIEFQNLPDSTPLVIRYSVSATFDSNGSTFANKAFWKGYEKNTNGETQSDKVYYVVDSYASVNTHGALLITKYDSMDESNRLKDAEFALYRALYRDHSEGYLEWVDTPENAPVRNKRYLGVYLGAYEAGVHHDTEIHVRRKANGSISQVLVPVDKNDWNSERVWMTLNDAIAAKYEFHHELEYDANGNIQVYYGEVLGRGRTDDNGNLSYGLGANLGFKLDENGKIIEETSESAKETEDRIHYNKIYAVVETKAPEGYQIDSTPHFFVIPKDKNLVVDGDLESGSYFYHKDWPSAVHVVTQYRENQPTYLLYVPNPRQPLEITKTFSGSATGMRPGTYTVGIWKEADGANPTKETMLDKAVITYTDADFGYYSLGVRNGEKYVAVYTQHDGSWSVTYTGENGSAWGEGIGPNLPTDQGISYGLIPGREKTAVFNNLPYGTYYVYELNSAGYPADAGTCTLNGMRYNVTVSGSAVDSSEFGKLSYSSGHSEVKLNNAYFDLAVTKSFIDKQLNSNAPIPGTYRFGIWQESDIGAGGYPKPGTFMAADIVELTWTADESEVLTKVGYFSNLKPSTSYRIFELDADGAPVLAAAVIDLDGKQFKVDYKNGNLVNTFSAVESNHPASVMVENEVAYFRLPETGGLGARMYTLGGALTLGAGLVLGSLVKRKRERRQED